MADELKIQIALTEELNKAREVHQSLTNSQNYTKENQSKVSFGLSKLETAMNQDKMTLEDLKTFRKIHKEIVTILTDVLLKEKQVTTEFTKSVQKVQEITDQVEAAREKLGRLQAKGSVTEKGSVLKSTYVAEAIDGLTYGSGSHKGKQVQATSFWQEGKRTDFSIYSDPKKAEKIYQALQATAEKLPDQFAEVTQLINNLQAQLQKAKEESEKLLTTGDQKTALELSTSQDTVNKIVNTEIQNQQDIKEIDYKNQELVEFNKEQEKSNSLMGKAFKNFTLYAFAMRALKKVLREVQQTVVQLDKSLTEQAMVTGLTRQQTYGLLKSYQDLAAQTGATTKEVASVATEYMKQGKSIQDALTLTQAAVSAAKIAGISTADSVNYLTTALNGFRLSAEDAMLVSDKFAAVAASSATDYNELAVALSKVASQANLAGMSIDYTTALLAKGLETTREAPETMGTALKTIIARMREMSDYGETLEGDTDVNNVETQLRYVDIALKNTNGELRSTEDVLDELGRKWNTLSTNQQAAIAKALAGTRQQSRLIAMMDDYDRVIELQQISMRSAGATSAQAATYLEGLEASINKVNVAVEKLVSTFTNSDAIQSVISTFGDLLEMTNSLLSNSLGMQVVLTAIAAIFAQMAIKKAQSIVYAIEENKLSKQYRINELQIKRVKLDQQKISLEQRKSELESLKIAKEKYYEEKRTKIISDKRLSESTRQSRLAALEVEKNQEMAELGMRQLALDQEELALKNDYNNLAREELALGQATSAGWTDKASAIGIASGSMMSLISGSQVWLGILGGIGTALTVIGKLIDINKKKQDKQNLSTLIGAKLEAVKAAFKENWWIGLAVLGALAVAGITLGIVKGVQSAQGKNDTKAVQDLNKEIYDLTKRAESMQTVISKFDELDEKIIKTNDDLKEMNNLLTSAADSLDDSEVKKKDDIGYGKGINQKQAYEALTSNVEKRAFLEEEAAKTRQQIIDKYAETRNRIDSLRSKGRLQDLLTGSSEEARAIRDSIYSYNNFRMYNVMDELVGKGVLSSTEASSIETWTQKILENVDALKAEQLAQSNIIEKNVELIAQTKLLTKENGEYANVLDILSSNDYALSEQVNAYKMMLDTITDPAIKESFKEIYKSLESYSQFTEQTLDYLDKMGLTAEKINSLNSGYRKLDSAIISKDQYQARVTNMLADLANSGGDIETTIRMQFDDILNGLDEKKWKETWKGLVNIMEDALGTGMTNMGQLLEKEFSRVNNFYENSAKWSSMKITERMSFIQDNADLFAGAEGEAMLKAFETGDYNLIQQALKSNSYLQEQRTKLIQKAETDLALELAKNAEDQNKSYIAILREYIKELNDVESFYQADLETRLNKENKQLEEFKKMLEAQQEAVENSLNKRKEAYEKYYEAINEQEEDTDYEKESTQLQTNLAKLATSSDASAVSMRKELEQSLQDLEEERLKTLRERAQEAVLNSMDDELSAISAKFDDVLNNQQALLTMFNKQLEDPSTFLSNLITSQAADGKMTQLQLDSWLNTFKTTYSGVIDSNILDALTARTDSNGNLTINIGGDEVVNVSQSDAKALADALKAAIIQYGGGIVGVRK